jgi:hypothetical protein
VTDRSSDWIATALRHHGLEPDPLHFPGRLMSTVHQGLGAFLWCYRKGGRRFEFKSPSRRLTNADVSSMLFRAGLRIEIPAEDLNGEAHPRLTGELELRKAAIAPEALSALTDDTAGLLSADRDSREEVA